MTPTPLLPHCTFMCNMYDALTLIHEYHRGIQCIRMYWFLLLSHMNTYIYYMNTLCSSLWNLKLLTGFYRFLRKLPVFLFVLFPTLSFFPAWYPVQCSCGGAISWLHTGSLQWMLWAAQSWSHWYVLLKDLIDKEQGWRNNTLARLPKAGWKSTGWLMTKNC